jgi:ATP-dependent DNA helicase RecG
MFLRELTYPVTQIPGSGRGTKTAAALERLGITTMADLLCHVPRRWEDWSGNVPIRDFSRAPVCTVAKVLAHDLIDRGRVKIFKVHIEDQSGRAALIRFNYRPYMRGQFVVGNFYRIHGNFSYRYGELQSTDFKFEEADREAPAVYPYYHLTANLSDKTLRRLVTWVLDRHALSLENELPRSIIERDGLLSKAECVRALHFPPSMEILEKARKTLIYEELFYLEIMVGKRAMERRARHTAPGKTSTNLNRGARTISNSKFSPLQNRLLERLPFSLTGGQAAAVGEINGDMDGQWPMARLLQGDVGSGKTLVAFLAALKAVEEGGQAAIMAPTELLARQHAENAARLLEPLGIRPAFLSGNINAAGRKELVKNLAGGSIDIVAGTHALFSGTTVYHDLRLVIVDEQHRFGVTQRALIMAKGSRPHLLMMSATPIPRSLALTLFGDMDVTVIRDMPPGRKPVITHLARESNEQKVYDVVRRELAAGHQAYFVYPLIGDDDEKDPDAHTLKDASSMAEKLSRQIFPGVPLALIHSKVDEAEKQRIMEDFRTGKIKILTATSVVEVGVDVPNATCMVIEHAERFGLSALHQLRGRVGRGGDQSWCFLIYSEKPENGEDAGAALSDDGKSRLKVMLNSSDGFVIAEEDLKLRGPGQIAGTEQSGYLSLTFADPLRDIKELERARNDAFKMLENDPDLRGPENAPAAEVLRRAPPFQAVKL